MSSFDWKNEGQCPKCGEEITTWTTMGDDPDNFSMFPKTEQHTSHVVDGDTCKYNVNVFRILLWRKVAEVLVTEMEMAVKSNTKYAHWRILSGYDKLSYALALVENMTNDELGYFIGEI